MISRRHRFHGYGSLNPVYRQGISVRGSLMALKYAPRDAGKPYRVAVVVSKKVHKSAVVRNRIRRRVYEAVRLAEAQVEPGTDLVFTVFSDQLATTEAAKITTIVGDLLEKAQKAQ